jgi:hypothetical protein
MSLKSQDVLVLLKLVALGDAAWTYNSLAVDLDLSPVSGSRYALLLRA